MGVFIGADSKKYHPPFPILSLYNITVADYRDLMLKREMSVSDDRIAGAYFIITVYCAAAGHHDTVVCKGAAFCHDEVIVSVLIINVGSLYPFAACLISVPDNSPLPFELKCKRVQFTQINARVPFILSGGGDIVAAQ